MKYKKIKLLWLSCTLIAIGMLIAANFAFGQYDYYDPYSNSNIDYFPMNPVNTSPSRTDRSTSTDSKTTTDDTVPTTSIQCVNRPKQNPMNTQSVEIRDSSGTVFYLSPPKEEVVGIRAYPESSEKIFKIIYGDTGMQTDEAEVGLITVDNQCYPKYGYIQNDTPAPSDDVSVPSDKTAVRLDPETGKVYNEKTDELISDARYDVTANEIYYKDTHSIFGKVFTETTGYVNIQRTVATDVVFSIARPSFTKKCSKKTALQHNEEPYHFCYSSNAMLVGIMPATADLKMASPRTLD